MGMFLLYAAKAGDRNPGSWNCVLVEAADVAAARLAGIAEAPNGHAKLRPTWAAVDLGTGTFPDARTVAWFQGNAAAFLGMDSGGNRVPFA